MKKFIIEVRELDGSLSSTAKLLEAKKAHPFFFSKRVFTMDQLVKHFSSVNGKWVPIGPMQLPVKMEELRKSHGITYRHKTWF